MKEKEVYRLFLGVPLPEVLHRELDIFQKETAAINALNHLPGFRWVPAENRHLTLLFMGDVAQNSIPETIAATQEISADQAPLQFENGVAEVAPFFKKARMIWLRFAPQQAAEALHQKLATVILGYPKEDWKKPFVPHITLARFRETVRPTLQLPPLSKATTAFTGQEVCLYRSILSPAGAQYAVLESWRLGG